MPRSLTPDERRPFACACSCLGAIASGWPVIRVFLAQAEARRRAIQVNKAADEIQRGYQLIDERKAEEALAVFSATYEALPNIPLAQEHRLAARNGYVVAGCLHAQELAARGDIAGAGKLLEKLLSPLAPNDFPCAGAAEATLLIQTAFHRR
jgi:hypothetical protein